MPRNNLLHKEAAEAPRYAAFLGERQVASGELSTVVLAAKELVDRDPSAGVFIFAEDIGRPMDVNFSGAPEEVLARLDAEREAAARRAAAESSDGTTSAPVPRRPGRPRLGVVSREVTLLPQQWAWLNAQPGGASAALRRLVHDARRANAGKDRVRHAREAAYRFSVALAGDAPDFEEAMRALFAGDEAGFMANTERWPADVCAYARRLANRSFGADG